MLQHIDRNSLNGVGVRSVGGTSDPAAASFRAEVRSATDSPVQESPQ